MNPRQTRVSILRASRIGDVLTTELRLEEGSWPTEPLAPATVWGGPGWRERVVDVHRLLSLEGDLAIFESRPGGDVVPGGPYALHTWWTPDQLGAAGDMRLKWRRRAYDGRAHDHCLLTWQTIRPGDMAYVSDAGWISVEAYERFIRDDEVGLRGSHEGRTA